MNLYRIADARHPIWDGQSAVFFGGRWSSPGRPVIYTSLSYSGAMLEVLALTGMGVIPKDHRCVVATVADSVSFELHTEQSLPEGWREFSGVIAREFGDQWLSEKRSAVLVVPSTIIPFEFNAMVNPDHPDVAKIIVADPIEVFWGPRLFSRSGSTDKSA